MQDWHIWEAVKLVREKRDFTADYNEATGLVEIEDGGPLNVVDDNDFEETSSSPLAPAKEIGRQLGTSSSLALARFSSPATTQDQLAQDKLQPYKERHRRLAQLIDIPEWKLHGQIQIEK